MFVQIINRTAVIQFGAGSSSRIMHDEVIDELVHLAQDHFKSFVFDFDGFDMEFGSATVGLLLGVLKKLVELGAAVTVKNITKLDYEMLSVVGLEGIGRTVTFDVLED